MSKMSSWGAELWDKYDQVIVEVGQAARQSERFYGDFFKQRSRIEEEYEKN